MAKTGSRKMPTYYFQIDPDGTEVINIFESMRQIDDYFNKVGVRANISKIIIRHPRSPFRVEGYMWAALPKEYCSNLDDDKIEEEALLQVQDLVFRFLSKNISLKKIDPHLLRKLNEIMKKAHLATKNIAILGLFLANNLLFPLF